MIPRNVIDIPNDKMIVTRRHKSIMLFYAIPSESNYAYYYAPTVTLCSETLANRAAIETLLLAK